MYFLIYSSYATSLFTQTELKNLLIQAREKNKKLGITGMLVAVGLQFVQMLEGDENKIKSLYQHISKDTRHKSVVLLKEGNEENPVFPDWSMGFKTVSPKELEVVAGYKPINSSTALQLFIKLSEKENG